MLASPQTSMSAKESILQLLLSRLGSDIPREEIIRAAASSEWARRLRELRDSGYQIERTNTGYKLTSKELLPAKDNRGISQKLRYKIIQAANGACQSCGARVADGAVLVIDHRIPVAWGGKTVEENLWGICTVCNQGKRDFYSDQNADVMRKVMDVTSAKGRILAYFRLNVGKKVGKDELILVSRISEWARRVRDLRAEGWGIVSFNEEPSLKPGEYILRQDKKAG